MKEAILDIQTNTLKENLLLVKRHIYLCFKRLFDFTVALVAIIPFLLLLLLVKIVYMLSGDFAPVMFKHTRIKENGKEFGLYKFRTMVPNAEEILKEMLKKKKYREEWEEFHKFDNDPRITKMGNILRKTSLDEIPQILNILKGDMAIIGPRPLIQEEVDAYGKRKDKLLSVKPGLTGWWAVNGRSATTNKKRMELELFYIDNLSLKLDIKIFFMTIIKVFKRDGAK